MVASRDPGALGMGWLDAVPHASSDSHGPNGTSHGGRPFKHPLMRMASIDPGHPRLIDQTLMS